MKRWQVDEVGDGAFPDGNPAMSSFSFKPRIARTDEENILSRDRNSDLNVFRDGVRTFGNRKFDIFIPGGEFATTAGDGHQASKDEYQCFLHSTPALVRS